MFNTLHKIFIWQEYYGFAGRFRLRSTARHACWYAAQMLGCILLLGQFATAQHIDTLGSDPFMSYDHEQVFLKALKAHDDASWAGITVASLSELLEQAMPTFVNRVEL